MRGVTVAIRRRVVAVSRPAGISHQASSSRARRKPSSPRHRAGAPRSTPRDGTASPTTAVRDPRTPARHRRRSRRGHGSPWGARRSRPCGRGRRRHPPAAHEGGPSWSCTRIGRNPCSTLPPSSIAPPAKRVRSCIPAQIPSVGRPAATTTSPSRASSPTSRDAQAAVEPLRTTASARSSRPPSTWS